MSQKPIVEPAWGISANSVYGRKKVSCKVLYRTLVIRFFSNLDSILDFRSSECSFDCAPFAIVEHLSEYTVYKEISSCLEAEERLAVSLEMTTTPPAQSTFREIVVSQETRVRFSLLSVSNMPPIWTFGLSSVYIFESLGFSLSSKPYSFPFCTVRR